MVVVRDRVTAMVACGSEVECGKFSHFFLAIFGRVRYNFS